MTSVPPHRGRGRGAINAFHHRSMLDVVVCVVAARRWGAYPRTFARADPFARPGIAWPLGRLGAIPTGGRTGAGAALVVGCDVLVPPGLPHAEVTAGVAHVLRELLGTAERAHLGS